MATKRQVARGSGGSMRAATIGVMAGLAGAGCDGLGAASAEDSTAVASESSEPVQAPERGPMTLAPSALAATDSRAWWHTRPAFPTETSPGDDTTCVDAPRLGSEGIRGLPVLSGGEPVGCFDSGAAAGLDLTAHYYRVRVPAGTVATVALEVPMALAGYLWAEVAEGCGQDLGCGVGAAQLQAGVAIVNDGLTPIERVVSVLADRRLAEVPGASPRLDLRLTMTRIAANARCDARLPVDQRLEGQVMAGAGLAPAESWMRRTLYYSVTVPPRTRATVHLETDAMVDATPLFAASCDAASWTFQSELVNPDDEPREVVLVVASSWSASATPFSVVIDETPLIAEGRCEQPLVLAPGDAATLALEGGGLGPASCWCAAPNRAAFVSVAVPAGATVDVTATVPSADGSLGTAFLIGLDSPCASACGEEFAFSEEGVATLALANPGAEPVVRHLLVNGNAGWDDPRVPAVVVRATAR